MSFIIEDGLLKNYDGTETEVTIPESVTEIGWHAFYSNRTMERLIIPANVKKIKDHAFVYCNSLKTVELQSPDLEICVDAFSSCPALAEKDGFAAVGGLLINCTRDEQDLVIPEGITAINSCNSYGDDGAFSNKASITELHIPKSMLPIKNSPFYGFSKLKKVYIYPASIGSYMFGSSGKTIELVLLDDEKEPVCVIGAFRKDYYVQTFNIKEDHLLPTEERLADYDKLVACGKHEGFSMNEDGRLQAMLFRLSDKAHPVSRENGELFADFLRSKLSKAIKFAEERENAGYIEILRDIGAIEDSKKKKIQKQLAGSAVESIRALANQLDEVTPFVYGGDAAPAEELPDMDEKFLKRIKQLQAKALVMRNGLSEFPDVQLADGSGIAPREYVTLILAEYIAQGDSMSFYTIPQLAEEAAALLDRTSFSDALWQLYQSALKKNAAAPAVCRFCESSIAMKIHREYKKATWSKPFALGLLLLIDSREAMLAADKEGYLGRYAAMRGLNEEQLRDTVVYDFGFDENGTKTLDLGTKQVEIFINADLTLNVRDLSNGKISKTIPKKGADPELYAAAAEKFNDMKKNIKKAASTKCATLFPAFLSGETFPAEHWAEVYVKNPLLSTVAKLLVWTQNKKTFTLSENGPITADGCAYTLGKTSVKLAHPAEMDAADVTAWQKYFTANGLKQPFEQIWEPVIDPADITPDRYADCYIPYYRFLNQTKHGITVEDFNFHNDIEISFSDCFIEVERIDYRRHDIDVNDRFRVNSFQYKTFTRKVNHIVTYLDRCTVYDRIRSDDVSIVKILPRFTLAQITDFVKVAIENSCPNVSALLLEYKNANFADFDPMDEFSLDF